jgi:hypothetical protein
MKDTPYEEDLRNPTDHGSGFADSNNTLIHPDVDMEALYKHESLGWLFT